MHVEVTCPAGTNMHICITCFAMQLAVGSKLILIPATSISICGLGPRKIHYRDYFGILSLGEVPPSKWQVTFFFSAFGQTPPLLPLVRDPRSATPLV